jgi:hypothetical protein
MIDQESIEKYTETIRNNCILSEWESFMMQLEALVANTTSLKEIVQFLREFESSLSAPKLNNLGDIQKLFQPNHPTIPIKLKGLYDLVNGNVRSQSRYHKTEMDAGRIKNRLSTEPKNVDLWIDYAISSLPPKKDLENFNSENLKTTMSILSQG